MAAAPNLRRRAPRDSGAPAAHAAETTPVGGHKSHAEPGRPNPYPHRLSVDVDTDTYRTLRLIAAQEGCRLIDLVRAAIAHEIATRQ